MQSVKLELQTEQIDETPYENDVSDNSPITSQAQFIMDKITTVYQQQEEQRLSFTVHSAHKNQFVFPNVFVDAPYIIEGQLIESNVRAL